MSELNSFTRLKVKRDTFFLPVPNGVYFRNNVSSFRMDGSSIYQWVEKLMPLFNGKHTLGELTDGLTLPYRNRVYEIGETLYKNGFVRDISHDQSHQLNIQVLDKYASQIEFIESFLDSGGYHFQQYRQAKVLAIGAGPSLVSLVSSLLESGLPKFHLAVTESVPTNRSRIKELVDTSRMNDTEVDVEEISFQSGAGRTFWRKMIHPYDWVLFISQDGNIEELLELNLVCKEERKGFIPAIMLERVGLAGPLVHPESDGCWESAWRRLHQSVVQNEKLPQTFSSAAGAILANVSVFELFKKVTGVTGGNQGQHIFRLDLETLEGEWLTFLTHPLVSGNLMTPRLVADIEEKLSREPEHDDSSDNLLNYFSQLASPETGIFHTWEEQNLTQLPLSQCLVQPVNPISNGPAELLPEVVCCGLTHEEALREAGLTGIEMYVSKTLDSAVKGDREGEPIQRQSMGIGAGETFEEALCRGLQDYLQEKWRNREADPQKTIFRLQLGKIEDKHCRFYLNALTTLNGTPAVGLEKEIFGFPVIWVKSNGRRYTGPGLNTALAFRSALQQALLEAQNQVGFFERETEENEVLLKMQDAKLDILSSEELTPFQLFQSSRQVLSRNNLKLKVYDLSFEPFLKQSLAGAYGVFLNEEET